MPGRAQSDHDGSFAELIAAGETLWIEFKSDRRKLSDDELVEAVVCLANTDGGQIILGVEDDGTPTGLHLERKEPPSALQAVIFNRTDPPTAVEVRSETIEQVSVYVISVKRSEPIVATSQGKCVRRINGTHGPECVPFPPSQHASRKGDLRLLDYSAAQLEQCGTESLDAVAMARLRNQIRLTAPQIAELSDPDILAALGLSSWIDSENRCLTVAALLCLGTEDAIARWLPTHEVAFQVFGADETLVVNEFRRGPLLSIIEELELRFDAVNKEVELDVGLARVGVRDYPKAAFREALLNSIVHRDYARKGAVYVQVFPGSLQISNQADFHQA